MENRDLLKQFYEEQLQPIWKIDFETLDESSLKLLEKTICFSKWKLDKKVNEFKAAINNMGKSARKAAKSISDFTNQLNF